MLIPNPNNLILMAVPTAKMCSLVQVDFVVLRCIQIPAETEVPPIWTSWVMCGNGRGQSVDPVHAFLNSAVNLFDVLLPWG